MYTNKYRGYCTMYKSFFASRRRLFTVSLLSLSSLVIHFSLSADQNNQPTKVDAAVPTQLDAKLASDPKNIQKLYDKSFKSVDLNSDGKISFDEREEFKEKNKLAREKREASNLIKGCDKNKDGMIGLNELPAEDEMRFQLDMVDSSEMKNIEEMLTSRCMIPKEVLEIMDFNEDGLITPDELLQGISSDRTPNKKIEKKMNKKRLSREAKRRKKEFSKCDTNGDEILTLREAFSMRCNLHLYTEQFDAYDTNSDSVLTIDELAKVVKPVEFQPPEDPEFVKRRKNMPPLSRLQAAMYECDKDEDGRLSKSETVGVRCEQDLVYFDTVDHNLDGYVTNKEIDRMRSKQVFDRMDKNKDGFLDAKEYKGKRVYQY